MRYKITLLVFLGLMFLAALSQMFMIYPGAEKMYPLFKSACFAEYDRQFRSVADSYRLMKIYGQDEYARAFLAELARNEKMIIHLYDERGDLVMSSGKGTVSGDDRDGRVREVTQSLNPEQYGGVRDRVYFGVVPLLFDKRDLIRHPEGEEGKVYGVMTFEREYKAIAYFSGERKIIFALIAFGTAFLIFLAVRWDPDRRVKELFDK
ncbi:MAG TPA: hypothetical protein PKK43_08460 [Spirochaetota bacterium]|nr:hypothetical protein [Spirochaetota bacterium]